MVRSSLSWPMSQRLQLARELGQPVSTTSLTASVEVAHLLPDSGTLQLPRGVTSALLEIGCSDFDTMDETALPKKENENAFLLSFEPLLDKYAVLLARGSTRFNNHTRDRAVPLGRHHRQGIVLPIAVSPNGGPVNFTVGTTAGCSSMMPLANARAAAAAWCGSQLETRRVPSISLPTAIGLLGDTLPISFLKIDAQGADFELIRVTPPALLRSRVSLIGMEARSPTCPPLYQGQATCDVVAKYMRSIGFRSRGAACPVGRNMTTGACLRPMPQHNSTSVYFEMASYLCCERNAYYERI